MKSGKLNIYLDFLLLLVLVVVAVIVFRMWSKSIFIVGMMTVNEKQKLDLCDLVLLHLTGEYYPKEGNQSILGSVNTLHYFDMKVCSDCREFEKRTFGMGQDLSREITKLVKCPIEYCRDGVTSDTDKDIDEFYPNKPECGKGVCYLTCEQFNTIIEKYPDIGRSVRMEYLEIKDADDLWDYAEIPEGSDCREIGGVCSGGFVECEIPLHGTKKVARLHACALR